MSDRLNEIARLGDVLASANGTHTCASSGVSLFRDDSSVIGSPVLLRPGILIGIRGQIEVRRDVNVAIIDPGAFLLTSVGMPVRVSTIATPGAPLIFLQVAFDHAWATEIVLGSVAGLGANKAEGTCQTSGFTGEDLQDVVHRILKSFDDELACRFLMPGFVRELHFKVLNVAADLPLLLGPDKRTTRGKVLCTVESLSSAAHCAVPIETLAAKTQMSLSSYHSHFKAIFGCTPLEYQKAVQLHSARQLLKTDDRSIAEIGRAVGYGGASQFSREYRRYFGCTARHHSKVGQEIICELDRL